MGMFFWEIYEIFRTGFTRNSRECRLLRLVRACIYRNLIKVTQNKSMYNKDTNKKKKNWKILKVGSSILIHSSDTDDHNLRNSSITLYSHQPFWYLQDSGYLKVTSSQCINPQGHAFSKNFELPKFLKKLRKDFHFVTPSQFFMYLAVQNP